MRGLRYCRRNGEWRRMLPKVRKFLDQAQAAGLKVVMDGGFQLYGLGFYRLRLGSAARRQETGVAKGTRAELDQGH